MTSPPTPPQRIRLTISVSPEVHAVYKRMAAASGSSIGSEMGEWLASTLQAANDIAGFIESARSAPGASIRQVREFTDALQAFERTRIEAMADASGAQSHAGAKQRPGSARGNPPSSNTGGKGPKTARGTTR